MSSWKIFQDDPSGEIEFIQAEPYLWITQRGNSGPGIIAVELNNVNCLRDICNKILGNDRNGESSARIIWECTDRELAELFDRESNQCQCHADIDDRAGSASTRRRLAAVGRLRILMQTNTDEEIVKLIWGTPKTPGEDVA